MAKATSAIGFANESDSLKCSLAIHAPTPIACLSGPSAQAC